MTLAIGGRPLVIGQGFPSADCIDRVLNWAFSEQVDPQELAKVHLAASRARRKIVCTLGELADARSNMVAVGAHSISHINLAQASDIRLSFEVSESRRMLIEVLGECDSFAYPYGMAGTFSATTSRC